MVFERRLLDALAALNSGMPVEALDDAFRKLTRPQGASVEARNRAFHRMLVNGVEIEYRDAEGTVRGDQVRVIDFESTANNDWLAVNQFTVTESQHTRRPDVVLFVNGLPLGLIELKNPADEEATIRTAWNQLQTYKAELPTLFAMNEALVASDGIEARIGTLTGGWEWFKPWRTVTGEALADPHMTELQVMLQGVFEPSRFLALLRDFIDGFARHMRDALPNASFVGFTGTPIELQDANTRAVFGDYISVYDIQRSVEDGATVPIYYEGRLAKLALDDSELPHIDQDFEEATEGEEIERKEKLKTKWAQLEAVVGAEQRVRQIAEDIVAHFEQRLDVIDGKAMIVCMSRRICTDLYRELVRLRPDWHDNDDGRGGIKVVMTGSASDPVDWQPHIRNKPRREALAKRFRDPSDPLRIVLVRDMWLTGFDAPSLHTMYVDKPMRGHGLMQAIARVNRVFKDKPGGLVVDYLGLAQDLKKALATYTESGGEGDTALDQEKAVTVMLEKYDVCRGIFHGFDWSLWTTGTPQQRIGLLPASQEHVLAQEDGKQRCLDAVRELSQAFALAVPHDETKRIGNDVGFFQAVRAALLKKAASEARPEEDLDFAVRQIISQAVAAEGVMDIFAAAGLRKPDISVLSDEFLSEVQGMPHRNLAVELLEKLLKGEVSTRRRKNVVQARSFAEMLETTLRRYQNRAIEAAQVIEELIALAREMREANARGEQLGLSEDELAFYDALETNDSAVQVLGDETLRDIARELVDTVRNNVTIDWTLRENVRANLRRLVRRTLRKHGYPPDKQEKATQTVLEQAEVLSQDWATA